MENTWLDPEAQLRLGVFVGVFALMALWEVLAPRRQPITGRRKRWPSNLGIVVLNTLLLRLLFPLTAGGLAMLAQRHQWGVLHHIALPVWAQLAVAFALLDLAIYLQHRLFHIVPVFWCLHRMHHADTEFDLTNGLRFHPLEIVLSMALKFALIVAIGAPALAVLMFEVVLNASSIFNHGNVALPLGLDRRLRWVLVTPDMHRVHHSVYRQETDSNFGFNLPWWDRLFGTYRAQPQDGHTRMQIGLPIFRNPKWLRLDRMLLQPWAHPEPDKD
ncbi:MAG: sterol desaturase family protein [Betaproteobacteria bacterium]